MSMVTYVVSIFVAFAPLSAYCGSEGGGGGYPRRAIQLLKETALELSMQIRSASRSVFAVEPVGIMPKTWQSEKWTPQEMADVIANVGQKSTIEVPGVYEGDLTNKVFDYDLVTKKIFALKPFYNTYNSISRSLGAERAARADIRVQFIHEFSHLLGIGVNGDDDASLQFAMAFLSRLSKYDKNLVFIEETGVSNKSGLVVDELISGYKSTVHIKSQISRTLYVRVVPSEVGNGTVCPVRTSFDVESRKREESVWHGPSWIKWASSVAIDDRFVKVILGETDVLSLYINRVGYGPKFSCAYQVQIRDHVGDLPIDAIAGNPIAGIKEPIAVAFGYGSSNSREVEIHVVDDSQIPE